MYESFHEIVGFQILHNYFFQNPISDLDTIRHFEGTTVDNDDSLCRSKMCNFAICIV